jgi:hypothetical protein
MESSPLFSWMLGDKVKVPKSLPRISVYIGESAAIVAPTHASGDGGPYYEQECPIYLEPYASTDLGSAIKKSFEKFSVKERNLRNLKKTDWPAYRASRCSSVKRFEAKFQHISISYLNSSGAMVEAQITFDDDPSYGVFTAFNPRLPDEVVGKKIEDLIHRFRGKGKVRS